MYNLLIGTFFFVASTLNQHSINTFIWDDLRQAHLISINGPGFNVKKKSNTVIVFLSPECPLCKNYIPLLNKLKDSYPGLNIVGLIPGKSYSLRGLREFYQQYNIKFNLYIDYEKKAANALKANTTPEAFLIDTKGAIRYRGLIDNWAINLGVKRKIITNHYLEDAIKDLANQSFQYKETVAVGCLINDL